MAKQLYRSSANKMVGGVIGGLAEYFDIDVSLIRLIFVLFLVLTGLFPLALVYIIWWVIVPEKPIKS